MKAVLDARWIIPQPSGIGVYTRELLRRLPGLAPDLKFVALFRSEALQNQTLAGTALADAPNLQNVVLPFGPFSPRSQFLLPIWLRRNHADLFHSPNYMLPFAAFPRDRQGGIRSVATVHDVIPFVLPDHAPRSRKVRLWPLFVRCVRESLARSDAIITVSATSRRDLIQAMRLAPSRSDRIRVVLNGVHPSFRPASEMTHPKKNKPRTILYVGRMDPYKNLVLLIRAFARLLPKLPFPARLLVVGPDDPRYPEAHETAGALGVEAFVRFAGFVSDSELAEMYRQADLLVNPSRYEGFGLQLIEAMRSGLPVVCSDGGALGEVAGEAAVVVPCDNESALVDGMFKVLSDPFLANRLRELGFVRSRQFSWERTAQETLSVYRELLENKD